MTMKLKAKDLAAQDKGSVRFLGCRHRLKNPIPQLKAPERRVECSRGRRHAFRIEEKVLLYPQRFVNGSLSSKVLQWVE